MIRYCFTTPQPSAGDFGSRSLAVWAAGQSIWGSDACGDKPQGSGNQAVSSCQSGLDANLFNAISSLLGLRGRMLGHILGQLGQMLGDVQFRGLTKAASINGLVYRTERLYTRVHTDQLHTDRPQTGESIWLKPILAVAQRHRSGRYRCKRSTVPSQD
jgi:hypothetical protein